MIIFVIFQLACKFYIVVFNFISHLRGVTSIPYLKVVALAAVDVFMTSSSSWSMSTPARGPSSPNREELSATAASVRAVTLWAKSSSVSMGIRPVRSSKNFHFRTLGGIITISVVKENENCFPFSSEETSARIVKRKKNRFECKVHG